MTKDSKTDEHVTPSRSERLEAANPPRRVRYVLLLVAVVAQAAGLMITWPLWNLRGEGVPHLPVFQGVPQFSFGWILIGTLLVIPFRPRVGVWLHLVVMVVACLFDQVRTQPQFLAVWVLMAAAVYDLAAVLARWFLSSLWIWAGVHKWVSPDWFSHRSWNMAFALGLDCESWAGTVAVLVVVSEFGCFLVLGLLLLSLWGEFREGQGNAVADPELLLGRWMLVLVLFKRGIRACFQYLCRVLPF